MPSPFPGMNPYLEQSAVWHDFHESFMPLVREELAAQVRPYYVVKIDEHVYIHNIHDVGNEPRAFLGRGGVTVARRGANGEQEAIATLEAPSRVRLPDVDTERLSFLEVRDRQSMRLVTVIELLSPANKQPGPDREQYIAKRSQLLNSTAHFVEIDLLRGGRMPMKNLAECEYYVLVSRAEERPDAGIWPIRLRDRLPEIPIPLTAPHRDSRIDLQRVLDRIYDAAGYEDYIYSSEPELAVADSEWARRFPPAPR